MINPEDANTSAPNRGVSIAEHEGKSTANARHATRTAGGPSNGPRTRCADAISESLEPTHGPAEAGHYNCSPPVAEQAAVTSRAVRIRGVILFVLCLMYFVAYVDRVNISVAGPTMRQELGLTPTELGFIFSAFAYPYAAMQIAGGWAADRFGPRRVLAILSLLWAAATMLTGLAWSVASLVWFRLLVGVGEGGAFPTATRALTCWLPVRERAFAQGITHSFARLGGAVTPPLSSPSSRAMDGVKRSMSSAQ